jgi:hypothetical protein
MVTEQNVTQPSASGLPLDMNNPTVNRRRERRIYYRQHFTGQGESLGYFPTLPLPADPYHINYYVNKKGFKLFPPEMERKQEAGTGSAPTVGELKPSQPDAISCPVEGCNKIVRSYVGLARHMEKVHALK